MTLNVKQQIKKQGFETSLRKKKTERRYISRATNNLKGALRYLKKFWYGKGCSFLTLIQKCN